MISELLRRTMRRVPQAVSILSSHTGHSVTLSSLTSISLDPAMICFSVRSPSKICNHLGPGQIFRQEEEIVDMMLPENLAVVQFLSIHNKEEAQHCAKPFDDRKLDFKYKYDFTTIEGVPILSDVLCAMTIKVINRTKLYSDSDSKNQPQKLELENQPANYNRRSGPIEIQRTLNNELFIAEIIRIEVITDHKPLIWYRNGFTSLLDITPKQTPSQEFSNLLNQYDLSQQNYKVFQSLQTYKARTGQNLPSNPATPFAPDRDKVMRLKVDIEADKKRRAALRTQSFQRSASSTNLGTIKSQAQEKS